MRLVFLLLSVVQIVLAALLAGASILKRRGFRWALMGVLVLSGLAWLWFGMRDLVAFETGRLTAAAPLPIVDSQLAQEGALLGVVQGGELLLLAPSGSSGGVARLTRISMVESVSPESREIDLGPYEGLALVVRGHDGGGWIYEAEIVEQGGPLLTALVQSAYRPEP
jgi:hypothetical protein